MKISALLNTAKLIAGQHAPEIYVGVGIALSVLTTVLAAKETPKVIIEESDIRIEEDRDLTFKEKVVIYAKHYWPAALAGIASIFLIVSGQRIQYKRTAAATALYLVTQDSLKTFTDHVVDEIGDRKVKTIRDNMSKDKMMDVPFDEDKVYKTGQGEDLCFDVIGGRYFLSSTASILKAESEMNKRMLSCNFISVNEFFIELDLPTIKFGDELGWDVALEGTVDIELSSQIRMNRPCIIMDSEMCPRWRMYA